MARSFDDLVKRTSTKRTRRRAAKRTKDLLGGKLEVIAKIPKGAVKIE